MSVPDYLPKVFVSHSWKDKKVAMDIVLGLRNLECANVWIDFENMNAGVDIDSEIYTQIGQADCVVLVWTENSADSDNVGKEISYAVELNLPIIPCFFKFDGKGKVPEELHEKLLKLVKTRNHLWVEFRNTNQAIVELQSAIFSLTTTKLPKDVVDSFRVRRESLKRMEGYNKYLTNYRNVQHKEAERAPAIDWIMGEIENLNQSGENKELIGAFMAALNKLKTSDPEAYRQVKPYLDQYNTKHFSPLPNHQFQIPASVLQPFNYHDLEKLRQNFVEMVQKENSKGTSYEYLKKNSSHLSHEQKVETLEVIINITADGLNLLNQAYILSFQAGLANELIPVLNYITQYYSDVNDLKTDSLGPFGWVDDSYLCFSTLQQINQVYYSIFHRLLFDVDLNPYLQFLMQTLEQKERYQLDNMLQTNFSALNWEGILIRLSGIALNNFAFGNYGTGQGYNQNSSWGNTWEDDMAQRAARLGISWNF